MRLSSFITCAFLALLSFAPAHAAPPRRATATPAAANQPAVVDTVNALAGDVRRLNARLDAQDHVLLLQSHQLAAQGKQLAAWSHRLDFDESLVSLLAGVATFAGVSLAFLLARRKPA